VGVPLTFVTGFTMIEVNSKFWGPMYYDEIIKYIACQVDTTGNECTSMANARLVALIAVVPICFALFGVTLLVYSFAPAPARELWVSHFKWLGGCWKTRQKPEEKVKDGDDSIPVTEI
jgi:hypothetical protein